LIGMLIWFWRMLRRYVGSMERGWVADLFLPLYPFDCTLLFNLVNPYRSTSSMISNTPHLLRSVTAPRVRHAFNSINDHQYSNRIHPSVSSTHQLALHVLNYLICLMHISSTRSHARSCKRQMWVETPKGKGKKPVNKDRFIS
jgi:hypothetical protein